MDQNKRYYCGNGGSDNLQTIHHLFPTRGWSFWSRAFPFWLSCDSEMTSPKSSQFPPNWRIRGQNLRRFQTSKDKEKGGLFGVRGERVEIQKNFPRCHLFNHRGSVHDHFWSVCWHIIVLLHLRQEQPPIRLVHSRASRVCSKRTASSDCQWRQGISNRSMDSSRNQRTWIHSIADMEFVRSNSIADIFGRNF